MRQAVLVLLQHSKAASEVADAHPLPATKATGSPMEVAQGSRAMSATVGGSSAGMRQAMLSWGMRRLTAEVKESSTRPSTFSSMPA